MEEKNYGKCSHCNAPCEVVAKIATTNMDGDIVTMPYDEYNYHPQPCAVWVKASEFDIKRNVVYHAIYVDKNQIIKGSGFFNINDWFIWDNKEIEERYKDDWGKLLILDESGTFAAP